MLMHVNPWMILPVAGLGLFAGMIGGMLGVGGSIVMLPGLALFFGLEEHYGYQQHVYAAAAMIANVAVAVPATLRHRRARVMVPQVLYYMMPIAVVGSLTGVYISNLPWFKGSAGGVWLAKILGLFLIYEVLYNLWKVFQKDEDKSAALTAPTITPVRSASVGAGMGLIGGLVGVGGGIIAVPLQQVLLRLPLRASIANSAAVMCVSAAAGAIYKNATLGQNDAPWYGGLILAAMLAPTCWLGGRLGAGLTHRLPIRQVRVVFIIIMAIFAWKLLAPPNAKGQGHEASQPATQAATPNAGNR